MIYIVTSGGYSDYEIEDVVERPTPISEEERGLMAQAYKECGGSEWSSVLCERFGFKKVVASELWGGINWGQKGKRRSVVRESNLQQETTWESRSVGP